VGVSRSLLMFDAQFMLIMLSSCSSCRMSQDRPSSRDGKLMNHVLMQSPTQLQFNNNNSSNNNNNNNLIINKNNFLAIETPGSVNNNSVTLLNNNNKSSMMMTTPTASAQTPSSITTSMNYISKETINFGRKLSA